jgi:hypothetical protein
LEVDVEALEEKNLDSELKAGMHERVKGMKFPDLTIRKDKRRRNTERCWGFKN